MRLYQQIYEVLRSRIVGGQYVIGEKLPAERFLTEEFGVSRTTIREALLALEVLGLVEIKVGSGVKVVRQDEIRNAAAGEAWLHVGPFELLEARRTIESEVAALAASQASDVHIARLRVLLDEMERENQTNSVDESADKHFHFTIAAATNNSAYESVVQHLWFVRETSPLLLNIRQKAFRFGVRPVVRQHRDVLRAIEQRDPKAAFAAMNGHLTWVIGAFLDSSDADASTKASSVS